MAYTQKSTIPETTHNTPGNKEFTIVRIPQAVHISLGDTG